jgi:hypothetical protein
LRLLRGEFLLALLDLLLVCFLRLYGRLQASLFENPICSRTTMFSELRRGALPTTTGVVVGNAERQSFQKLRFALTR